MKKLGLLFLSLLFTISSFSQNVKFLSKEEFKKKNLGVTVVEFWASWNSGNQYNELSRLSECNKYRVCIDSNMDLAAEYGVVSVPTIVIFNNGEERYRFQANVSFQLTTPRKDIQEKVDQVVMERFR